MMLLVAAAWAGSVVVAIREDGGAFSGAVPRVTVTDGAGQVAHVQVEDGGVGVDKTAKDAVWTGSTTALGAPPYAFLVTDGGDIRVWKGSFSGAGTEPVVVSLSVQSGGAFTELGPGALAMGEAPAAAAAQSSPSADAASASAAPPPAEAPQPAPPGEPRADGATAEPGAPGGSGGGASPGGGAGDAGPPAAAEPAVDLQDLLPELGSGAQTGAWALVIGVIAWVLAGARRFTASAVDALPGPLPPVAVHGVVPMDGEWDAFVRTLAGPFRVILVGAGNPGVVPGGTVFPLGTGRVPVDDVLALLHHLEPSGPPVVVVVVGGLEAAGGGGHEAALEELGRRLPRTGVVYAFSSDAPRLASSAAPR